MWSEEFAEINTELFTRAFLTKGEKVIRGWAIIFINEYNQEQDRVLVLTDQAYYRVKYNFKDQKVHRFQRIPLQSIYCIQKGKVKSEDQIHFGFRIFNREQNEEHNTPHYRTYRPIKNSKERVNQMVQIFANTMNQPDIVEEVEQITLSPSPLFTKAHNALGLGRQKRTNMSKSADSIPGLNEYTPTSAYPIASSPNSSEEGPLINRNSLEYPEFNSTDSLPSSLNKTSSVSLPRSLVDDQVKQEHITPDQKKLMETDTTHSHNWLLLMFRRMDLTTHLMLCIFAAFVVGYYNLSFLWVIGIGYLVYRIDQIRQEKSHKIDKRIRKRQLPQHNKWARQKPSDPETCDWMNVFMSEIWPHMSQSIALTTREKLISLLEYSMNQKKPTAVESMTISEINFGNIPPAFKNITAVKPPFPDCRIEFDISYKGPAQIILEVVLGGKFVNLRVPVAINEFDIKGRMRLELTFYSKSPYLHTLSYAFISQPQINVSIKPLKAIDVMEVPFLKESIEDSLRYLISTSLVLPEQMVIPYHSWYGTEIEPLQSVAAFSETKQADIDKLADQVEQSMKNDEYAGILHVRILEARKLQLVGSNNSNPYCIITTGPHEIFTTNAVKRVKNPIWNEFFELLVKKNRERKLEVTVMARDVVNGDDFLGMAIVDFTEFGKETKELWAKLESTNKRGMTVGVGEIHLQIRFVPPPDQQQRRSLEPSDG